MFVLGFAAALLMGFGCSSDNGGGSTGPALACVDGGAAPADAVAMSCAGATGGTTEQVNVVIGGTAAGTTTLRGVNFDVTYDPAKLTFTPEASYASPLFPNALVGVSLFDGVQGRIVVSIQQPGGLPDVAIPAGQNVTLSLSLARVSGATFASTPIAFENAEATGASSAINFGGTVSVSYQ
jgi:hypothetical protein